MAGAAGVAAAPPLLAGVAVFVVEAWPETAAEAASRAARTNPDRRRVTSSAAAGSGAALEGLGRGGPSHPALIPAASGRGKSSPPRSRRAGCQPAGRSGRLAACPTPGNVSPG